MSATLAVSKCASAGFPSTTYEMKGAPSFGVQSKNLCPETKHSTTESRLSFHHVLARIVESVRQNFFDNFNQFRAIGRLRDDTMAVNATAVEAGTGFAIGIGGARRRVRAYSPSAS
jgi:hypothetical protein